MADYKIDFTVILSTRTQIFKLVLIPFDAGQVHRRTNEIV